MKKAKKVLLALSVLLAALMIMPQNVNALSTIDIVEKVEANSLSFLMGGYFKPGDTAPQKLVDIYSGAQFTDYYNAAIAKDPKLTEYGVPYDVFVERMGRLFKNLPSFVDYEGSMIKRYDSQTNTIYFGLGGFGDPDHIEYVTYRQNGNVYEGYGIWKKINDTTGTFEDGEKVKITFVLEDGYLKIDGYEKVEAFPVDEAPADSQIITYSTDQGVQFDVSADKHSFYSTVEFVTEECDVSAQKAFIMKELNADDVNVEAYDIYMKSKYETNKVVSLEEEITVTLPIPEGWDAKATAVYYIDTQNNKIINMNGVVSADGQTISFKTDHFSVYALVQKTKGQTNTNPSINPPASTDQITPAQGDKTTPQTGDTASIMMYAGMISVSILAMGLFLRKRKKEN